MGWVSEVARAFADPLWTRQPKNTLQQVGAAMMQYLNTKLADAIT
jgi:hypothetical protein